MIKQSRINLRELLVGDVKTIVSLASDKEVSKHSTVPFPFTKEDAIQLLEKSDETINYGIESKDSGEIIGIVSLKKILPQHKRAEVGIWIGKKYWGKGYAQEAIMELNRIAFQKLGFKKLHADIREPNTVSFKLFKKCGYKLEATLRKHNCYNGQRYDIYKFGLLDTDNYDDNKKSSQNSAQARKKT